MSQRDTLFCGIDIGKARHVACVIDADGGRLMRSQSFTNDAAGFACCANVWKTYAGASLC